MAFVSATLLTVSPAFAAKRGASTAPASGAKMCHYETPTEFEAVSASWTTDFDGALVQAQRDNLKVLVLFATPMVSSHFISPGYKAMKMVGSESFISTTSGKFVLVYINAKPPVSAVAQKYGLKSWPTWLFLNADGTEISRKEGCPEDITQLIELVNSVQ